MYVLSKFPRKIKGWGVLLNGIWKVRGKWSSIFNRWRESSGPQVCSQQVSTKDQSLTNQLREGILLCLIIVFENKFFLIFVKQK